MIKLQKIDAVIQETTDRKRLDLLNRAWWREWFRLFKSIEDYECAGWGSATMSDNKTSLTYWFPKISALGIPVPRTHCMAIDRSAVLSVFDGKELDAGIISDVRDAARVIGYPLFLRTDLQSGKHGWKGTCYVPDEKSLISNMLGVAEENEMGACFFGDGYEALVFREFLDLDTSFIAFYGDMPINKERRYFISDGKVICHHPYWPEEAFEGHTQDSEWKAKLAKLNEESAAEIAQLSDYARQVSDTLEGYWSVDFAATKNGDWYLIDMATGESSYHWPNCERRGAAGGNRQEPQK